MNERKKLRRIIGNALYSLVPFELFYKIIGAVIFIPILISILNGTVRLSGFSYVTEENIFDFLLKPLTIFILFLLIIFFALYVFIEISAIVISINNALYGKRITLRYLVYQVLLSVKKTGQYYVFYIMEHFWCLNYGITICFILFIRHIFCFWFF